jgi:transposase InsO family protein
MPWKATNVMDERVKMISDYLIGDHSIAEIARRRGVSRKTAHKWIGRYQREPAGGLRDRSRAPRAHPNAVSAGTERSILEWKKKYPLWGAPKIHSKLLGREDCPVESTVSNILKRHGLTRQARRRARAKPTVGPPAAVLGPNDEWCVDFKGWFLTGNGRRCDPLTISDAYSRYLLCCQGMGFTGGRTVQPLFERVFREYGLPLAIRSDNGAPFASAGLGGLSRLSVWWLRLGIGLERIEPGHPEQNGRHERMHRTLKEAVLRPPRRSLAAQQAAFDAFQKEYNEERPHEALNQHVPGSVYEPSRRDYPSRLAEPEYPDAWEKRGVRSNGEIRWRGRKVYVSQALIGEWVGLKPESDGVWSLYFMGAELGRFNERTAISKIDDRRKRNRPINNQSPADGPHEGHQQGQLIV